MAMIIDELMQSPHMPRYLERLLAAFADDQGRRQRFYDTMTEQEKVEFINGAVVMQFEYAAYRNVPERTGMR